MNLIINPTDMPRHFARSVKGDWLIKRSPVTPEGFRYYACENWKKGGKMAPRIVLKARFLLDFAYALMEQRGIEVLVLSSENDDGTLNHNMTLYRKKNERRRKAA